MSYVLQLIPSRSCAKIMPLDMGVPDRGVMRDGHHYHDYYGRGRQ